MAVNAMQTTDVYQILNSLHQQATGRASQAPTNTAEFVSMATTTLNSGVDGVYNALMNTIGKTIFSTRPYDRKFKGLQADNVRFGGIIRKVSMADKPIQAANKAFFPADGATVDHYIVNKADVLEMRYYGSAVYQDSYTVFRDQLIDAFNSEGQLGSFIAMLANEMSNKWEQYQEELARATLANFIGAKKSQDAASIIHLLTEYNTLTGQTLTAQDVYKETNISGFFRWVRSRINTISRRMTDRSGLYQYQVAGKPVNRHTPVQDQMMYLYAPALDIIDTMVNTTTYHDEPLKYANVEAVNYWQSQDDPDSINVTPSIVNASGVVSTGEAQNVQNIFGLIFDRDAITTNVRDYIVANTPMNAAGLYYNTWLTANLRYTNDLTEKGVLLLLD